MSVTVRFNGICTHTQLSGGLYRVVLVRADHGARLNTRAIPPHIPKLKIASADIVSIEGYPYGLEATGDGAWRLCGVELSMLGGSGSPTVDDTFAKVPHLETAETLSISGDVTIEGGAACYFDVTSGTLGAEEMWEHGPIWGVLTDETNDQPVLNVKCFWNQKTSKIHLRPGAEIVIEHVGIEHDADQDFLLHYRVLERVPADAKVPEEKSMRRKIPGDISIGCSNSQYP